MRGIDNPKKKTTNRDFVGGNGFLLTQLIVVWSCYKPGHGPAGAAATALAPVKLKPSVYLSPGNNIFTDSHPLLSPFPLLKDVANILTVGRCVEPRINPSY